MIIDTSNAPCGPGFLPGLRLSEGRFAINRKRLASSAAGASQALVPSSSQVQTVGAPPSRGCPSDPHVRARLPVDFTVSALPALRVRQSGGATELPTKPKQVSLSVSSREPRGPPPRERRHIRLRPQIRRDNPLNLSILLSGGKETNKDSLSSGERRGKSPAPNPRPTGGLGTCGVWKTACPASLGGLSPSDRGSTHGRCEAGNGPRRAGVRSSRSRVAWECSPKRVVNSI